MPDLLCKPFGTHGKVHEITPARAGWRHVGFSLYRLRPGETAAEATGAREVILVMVEGKAAITAAGRDWGTLGARMNVFEKKEKESPTMWLNSFWLYFLYFLLSRSSVEPCLLLLLPLMYCSRPAVSSRPAASYHQPVQLVFLAEKTRLSSVLPWPAWDRLSSAAMSLSLSESVRIAADRVSTHKAAFLSQRIIVLKRKPQPATFKRHGLPDR